MYGHNPWSRCKIQLEWRGIAVTLLLAQVRRIEAAGGSIQGGRLVSGLQVDDLTGDITAVLSRDKDGHTTVHPADALVFAIGITGVSLSSYICDTSHSPVTCHV